ISRPTAGLVTTITEVHSRFFHSLDQIAETKFDLYRSLPADGITFLNMNDDYIRNFSPPTGRVVSYGIDVTADITASIHSMDEYSRVRLAIDGVGTAQLQVSGAFQGTNALAAAAVGLTFGVSPSEIRERLESFRAMPGRARILERNGKTIIDDSYNANPQSMKAALDILASAPPDRRKIAILGDMLELNSSRDQKHRDIGAYAASRGVDVVIGVGTLARLIADEAENRQVDQTYQFKDVAECIGALPEILGNNDTLLIKGSHGMQLEKILENL
ncbi:MAG TPA: UDP-N-acetylmuramoyl-tripeptide--D-alanyl-D-alanine ligase, partial [bacterium]|nr:UDP-N-acetylmuramoyl-tripeptide--D-alanyl-D-alanine ligase [bacterium]